MFRTIPAMAAIARAVRVIDVPTDGEGQSAAESKTTHKDNSCNNQVSGFRQINFILYHVADTNRRNHTIQHEADASDDGSRHGTDNGRYLRNKADNDRKYRSNSDNSWIMHTAQLQNAGILTVSGIGRTAKEYRQ